MAPRPFWTGYLKLSLVTCPVALTPATSDAERVRFHTLNRKTGNCVVSRYVDSAWQPVDDASQVKGYARDEGSFVLLEEDELQAVQLESARAIVAIRNDPKFGGLGVFRGLRIIHFHMHGRRFSAFWGSPAG